MICFARGYNQFHSGVEQAESVEIEQDSSEAPQDNQTVKELLHQLGEEYYLLGKEPYLVFCQRGLELAPRFMSRNMDVTASDNEDDPSDIRIGLYAQFPSENWSPFMEYVINQKYYYYPRDPQNSCPYVLVTNLIRRGAGDEAEKRFARDLFDNLRKDGRFRGRKVMSRLEVSFAKRVISEVCEFEER